MPDALIPILLQGGPWGFIVLVGVSLVRGWSRYGLIPSATAQKIIDVERRRAEDYKAAWLAADARADLQAEQLRELLEIGRGTASVVSALGVAARRE